MLQVAMKVLHLFSGERRDISMAEAALLMGRAPSTVSRWLRSMAAAGFLERDLTSGRYRLGTELVALGRMADRSSPLQRAARGALERLAIATGETTYLGVLEGSVAVLIDGVLSPQPLRRALSIGERVALHATATGKCLLAWKAETVVRRLVSDPLPAATDGSVTSVAQLLADLAAVKKRGFATVRGEWEEGLDSAAAPIRNRRGDVVAALSVGGPSARLGGARLDKAGHLALLHADLASAELRVAGQAHGKAGA